MRLKLLLKPAEPRPRGNERRLLLFKRQLMHRSLRIDLSKRSEYRVRQPHSNKSRLNASLGLRQRPAE